MTDSAPSPDPSRPTGRTESTEDARSFALSEDWIATGVGLAIVVLATLGVITDGWLPL